MCVDICGYSVMRDSPKILISSFEFPVPPVFSDNEERQNRYFKISENVLTTENVGTILNVAGDVQKTKLHDVLYEKLDIKYISLPINDELSCSLSEIEIFLDEVLAIYNEHLSIYKDKSFLVNCLSGINRSALAIAGILWKTRTTTTTTTNKEWSTPIEMIEYMRAIQLQDRGLWLLNNETFEEHLIKWCQKN